VTAPGGVFNSEANTLDFKESLAVKTTDGMRADFRSAAIDLATGSLKTSDPVRISMPGVVIEADRLQIDDNGARLLFESRVRLVVQPAIFKPTVSDVEPDAGSGG
jgi:lipopolysaccharide export system protein LptC